MCISLDYPHVQMRRCLRCWRMVEADFVYSAGPHVGKCVDCAAVLSQQYVAERSPIEGQTE